VQAVRAEGTNRWVVTSALSAGRPLFSVDLDALVGAAPGPLAQVHYGPTWDGFLWLGGRWRLPGGETAGESLLECTGSSGPGTAMLAYTIESSRYGLVMSTRMEFTPGQAASTFTIRLHQALCASRDTICEGSLDFLHVRAAQAGARDWGDGTPDYAWYRWQGGDCPDAPPGSHTGVIRVTDGALRAAAVASPARPRPAEAAAGSAAPGVPLIPGSAIGGYFSKTGVGSCGWVFLQYRASPPHESGPFFARGRSGADTHFRLSPADASGRLAMQAGDRIDAELSLTMLPCEVSREDIEDLNEADLHFFGTDQEQTASIAGWLGTRNSVGLYRSDGSIILLGLGREPARVAVPAATVAKAVNAYRLLDLTRPTYDYLDLQGNSVEVRPGWITVVDCGAVLWDPSPTLDSMLFGFARPPPFPAPEGETAETALPWPQPPTGGPFQGIFLRK